MKFARAIHVYDSRNRMMTFGMDSDGMGWLIIDSDKPEAIYRGPFENLSGFANSLINLVNTKGE